MNLIIIRGNVATATANKFTERHAAFLVIQSVGIIVRILALQTSMLSTRIRALNCQNLRGKILIS